MVFVAQTIIHKHAMMVKLLNTTVAKIAMVSVFRSKVFTMNAYIIKMVTFRHNFLQYILEIWLFFYITRICQSKCVKYSCT